MFLAKAVGLFFLIVSAAMLCHQAWWKKTLLEVAHNGATMAISAAVWLALGLLVVLTHNVWSSDWHVVVTLFGWLMVFQGVGRLFYPESFARGLKNLMDSGKFLVVNWIVLLASIYLVWVAFFREM
jgi:hypothetical protein